MNRKMSPRGLRRGQTDPEYKYETGNERLNDFNIEDESDSNIKYTSTPLKKIGANSLQERTSAPTNFDSEESTDAVKTRRRSFKRRQSSRSLRKDRISSARIIGSKDQRERRRRKSRRRRSEGNEDNLEGEGEADGSETVCSREKHLRRREDAEVPIAELLRNAQRENQKNPQTRYEDPIPLPELTTDTLYVQGRNGFSAVKIGNHRSEKSYDQQLLKPIHVAIKTHNLAKTLMFFCQGLLGGLALSQVTMVTKIHTDTNILEKINATNYPSLMSGIFLFLVTMSLVAAMDRIDLAHLDLEHLREIFPHRFITIITFPLYAVAICVHLSATIDDQNLTYVGQGLPGSSVADDEAYAAHRQTHTWKFTLCIIAWFCIALGPNDDMTTTHLEAMQKYAT